jgi:hypothetical protein
MPIYLAVINEPLSSWEPDTLYLGPCHNRTSLQLVATSQSTMEETATRDSTVFPPGYGDFALESSDRLICHFPRHLLAYMSETFRDMFSLPAREGQEGHSNELQTPLKVSEPGQILELFLQNIDPKQPTPSIDQSTIVLLLEAAQKYQASTITKWFEEEATLKQENTNPSQRSTLESFAATHPVLTLYCAVHFNLPTTGRFALQEFARCHISRTLPTKTCFDIPSYLEGVKLRENRREHFDKLIRVLAKPAAASNGEHRRAQACVTCAEHLGTWIMEMERAVRDEPNWRAFLDAYERCPDQCHYCKSNKWSNYSRSDLPRWKGQAKAVESMLPAWPF